MLVSIYMPTKNRVELLARAVDSVLAQTYPSWELLIVNDGSTDSTRAYLDAIAAREPRVRVFHQDDSRGAPQCRNRAIRAARGEFVTGLDDDDWFHAHRLAALVDYWRTLEAAGERFSCLYTQEVYVGCGLPRLSRKTGSGRAEDLYFHNLVGNQVFAPKQAFIDAGLFDEAMPAWQDLDLFIRLLSRCGPGRLLDSGLYFTSLDQRPDRLSVGSTSRIRAACRRLIGKSRDQPRAARQGLFLQSFGPLYGTRPGVRDLAEFLTFGVHPRNLKTLAGIFLRR